MTEEITKNDLFDRSLEETKKWCRDFCETSKITIFRSVKLAYKISERQNWHVRRIHSYEEWPLGCIRFISVGFDAYTRLTKCPEFVFFHSFVSTNNRLTVCTSFSLMLVKKKSDWFMLASIIDFALKISSVTFQNG